MAKAAAATKVPAEARQTPRENLIDMFTHRAANMDVKLDYFAKQLKSDPVNALQWSDSTFSNAAQRAISLQAVACLKAGYSREKIYEIFLENVLNKARFPAKSTSIQSDRMQAELAAAAADVMDIFKDKDYDLDVAE